MAYTELKELTEAVQTLNKHLDERVTTIESWQAKTEEKISKGGLVPAEAKQELDTINAEISKKIAEYKELLLQEKEAKLQAQRPGFQNKQGGRHEKAPATKAIEKWIRKRGDITALNQEERSLIDFNHMNMDALNAEQKVLVSAAADLGGFFAGTDLSDKFIQKLFLISPVRALADVQTIGGEKLLIPSEGTTDTNVFWSDEQTGFQASTDPNLGMLEIYARELNGYLKLSNQNLEDSVFDIEAFILKRLTRQFAQKEGTAFLTGDGVARPEGILTNAALSGTGINVLTSKSAATIVPADDINLMHQVKSGYRKTSTWLMSNNTIGVHRLYTDSQNRPLWTMFSSADGTTSFVETLFGRPIVEMPDMVNPTAGTSTYTSGKYPVIFGDINQAYQIVDRVGLTFQTLKELYAIQNQVAFLARMRVGGKVILPEALAVLKVQ